MTGLPLAHVLVAREDLPIPAWLFAWAAAIVLIVSFYALSALWREPRFEDERWKAIGAGFSKAVLSPVTQALCALVGIFLLGLAIYSGFAGTDAPDRNFALTFLFVTAWLGFPIASVIFGNVFPSFSPWRAVGRAGGWGFSKLIGGEPKHLSYPAWLGRWPAAVGVVAFVWLEIIYGVSGGVSVGVAPNDAAIAAVVYSVYTLAMMSLFGVETWSRRGETFAVYFEMFSQLSVFETREGRIGKRRIFSGAATWATVPGSLAVVIASIATTSFDGAAEGALNSAINQVYDWVADAGVGLTASLRLSQTLFLLLVIAGVALFYLVGVRGMQTIRNAPSAKKLRDGFAHTLIPIAFAYLIAHYFSLVVFQEQAQFTYLLSNPLGEPGTDLFGTASGGIDYGAITSNFIWYVQVGALVIGHVIGLAMAHDRAITYWRDPEQATRSQYWMLAVMVGFTCFGLYLLSAGNG